MKNLLLLLALFAMSVAGSRVAFAHSPASSHIDVAVSAAEVDLTFDLALADVAQLILLDENGNGDVTWSELLAAEFALQDKIRAATRLRRGSSDCVLQAVPNATALVNYSSVPHISLNFQGRCDSADDVYTLAHELMFPLDPGHRVLVRLQSANGGSLAVLTAADSQLQFRPGEVLPASAMVGEGFLHILEGYDHLLFLLLLILPLSAHFSLRRSGLQIAGIVTAFTIAHSITLALASLRILVLPAGPVEIAIAASIVVAGLLNLWRPGHRIGWRLAFGFGLLHGFGFAGALAEIGLSSNNFLVQLLAFNIGVELGQLSVVALALPLLLLVGRWPRCNRLAVPGLSAAGAGMGLLWVVSRL
jgi:HupE / UreJ protein